MPKTAVYKAKPGNPTQSGLVLRPMLLSAVLQACLEFTDLIMSVQNRNIRSVTKKKNKPKGIGQGNTWHFPCSPAPPPHLWTTCYMPGIILKLDCFYPFYRQGN